MMKTFTEKRFFEWHEDEVSVTLRNKGGSYGGVRGVYPIILRDTSLSNTTIKESHSHSTQCTDSR